MCQIVFTHKVGNLTWLKNHPGAKSAAVDETQQNRKSTAYVEAKLTLRRVKESSNAYPPLKSVAKDLWLILDGCKVWTPS